jgi:hypothetical protein
VIIERRHVEAKEDANSTVGTVKNVKATLPGKVEPGAANLAFPKHSSPSLQPLPPKEREKSVSILSPPLPLDHRPRHSRQRVNSRRSVRRRAAGSPAAVRRVPPEVQPALARQACENLRKGSCEEAQALRLRAPAYPGYGARRVPPEAAPAAAATATTALSSPTPGVAPTERTPPRGQIPQEAEQRLEADARRVPQGDKSRAWT